MTLKRLLPIFLVFSIFSCRQEEEQNYQDPSELLLRWRQDISNGASVPIHNAIYSNGTVAYRVGNTNKPQKWAIMEAETGYVRAEWEAADEDPNFPNAAALNYEGLLIEHGASKAQCFSMASASLVWEEQFTGDLWFANIHDENYYALVRDGQDIMIMQRPLLGGSIDTLYYWSNLAGNIVDFKVMADTLLYIQEDASQSNYYLHKLDLTLDSLLWSSSDLGYIPLRTWDKKQRIEVISNKVLVKGYQEIEAHDYQTGQFLWDKHYSDALGSGSFIYPFQDHLYVVGSQVLDRLDLNTGVPLAPTMDIGLRNRPVDAGRIRYYLFFTSYKDGSYQLNQLSLSSGNLQVYPASDFPYLHSSSVAVDPFLDRLFLYNPEESFAVDLANL